MTCMFFVLWAVTDENYRRRIYFHHWSFLKVGSLAKGWNFTRQLFSIWQLNEIGRGVEQNWMNELNKFFQLENWTDWFYFFDGVVKVLTKVCVGNKMFDFCIYSCGILWLIDCGNLVVVGLIRFAFSCLCCLACIWSDKSFSSGVSVALGMYFFQLEKVWFFPVGGCNFSVVREKVWVRRTPYF